MKLLRQTEKDSPRFRIAQNWSTQMRSFTKYSDSQRFSPGSPEESWPMWKFSAFSFQKTLSFCRISSRCTETRESGQIREISILWTSIASRLGLSSEQSSWSLFHSVPISLFSFYIWFLDTSKSELWLVLQIFFFKRPLKMENKINYSIWK